MRGGRGCFITLEGGEGAGKTTQLRLLAETLRASGLKVTLTREPGGAPGADEIRALLLTGALGRWDPATEALLHFAARREHLVHTVWPALETGCWVLSDRFADSTMAYQGYGHRLGRRFIAALYRGIVGDFAPDLTVILDVPTRMGLKRVDDRVHDENRYERMPVDFHERLRKGFLDIARREPDRCAVVDGAQTLEDIQAKIRSLVYERFGLGS